MVLLHVRNPSPSLTMRDRTSSSTRRPLRRFSQLKTEDELTNDVCDRNGLRPRTRLVCRAADDADVSGRNGFDQGVWPCIGTRACVCVCARVRVCTCACEFPGERFGKCWVNYGCGCTAARTGAPPWHGVRARVQERTPSKKPHPKRCSSSESNQLITWCWVRPLWLKLKEHMCGCSTSPSILPCADATLVPRLPHAPTSFASPTGAYKVRKVTQ